MSWRPDPEVDELFPDPRDRGIAQALRTVHGPEVTADPAFRSQLRRQLMQAAWQDAEPRLGFWRRLWAPQRVAWAMAGVGALLIAVVVYATSMGTGDRTVVIRANVDRTTPVAAVQPIELTFSQPMNRQSVQSALQIQPATSVEYRWTSDTQVRIVPVSGSFAPNTQYTLSLKPNVAQTQQGRPVPAATTPVVFTVAPTPTPTPTATPTPVPTPSLRLTVLGSASDVRPQWNYQDRIVAVGADGALKIFPIDGGAPEVLADSGVTAFALSPDGGRTGIAYIQNGQVKTWTDGTTNAISGPHVAAIAAGFSAARAQYASATQAMDPQGRELKLQRPAAAAWFAPDGSKLLYQASDHSLHLLDFASGKETAWPVTANASVLDWAPDGTRVLYSAPDGLYTADPAGQSATRLAALGGATAGAWTATGQLVVEVSGQLHQLAADGSGDHVLGPATARAFSVSSTGSIALVGGGQLAFAQPAGTGAAGGVTADSAAPAVGAFEKARQAGDQAGAAAVVASTARTIAPPAANIQRWFTVAAFPAPDGIHETVRVVLADRTGKDTSQLDESLVVAAGPDRKPVIASAVDGPARPYGSGPEVLSVDVAASRISVQFDSDLAPASVPAAIRLSDSTGKPVAASVSSSGRTVTIAPSAPLPAGTYRLSVGTGLLDANGRPAAAEFDLDIPLGAASSQGG